jgi:hypothetical protein
MPAFFPESFSMSTSILVARRSATADLSTSYVATCELL